MNADYTTALRKLTALSASASDGRGDVAYRVVPVYLTAEDHAALTWALTELTRATYCQVCGRMIDEWGTAVTDWILDTTTEGKHNGHES